MVDRNTMTTDGFTSVALGSSPSVLQCGDAPAGAACQAGGGQGATASRNSSRPRPSSGWA